MSDTLTLAKKLIAIPSVEGNTKALSQVLEVALGELKGFTVERFERNGAKSALVYSGKTRPARFGVMLNVHLDVIQAKPSQFTPKVRGGRLYGAGAMDMKSNAACAISVFKELAPALSYPVGLQLTTDEELGGFDGTKYQLERGVKADFVIATEPTNFDVVHKAKGILRIRISSRGLTAHGAYPWRGKNAILMMSDFLAKLQKRFPAPKTDSWRTTVNVAVIQTSNTALNKVPDDCTVELDVRFVPEDKGRVVPQVRKLLPKGFSLEVLVDEPSMYTAATDRHVRALAQAAQRVTNKVPKLRGANGASDARFFACPGVEFGPIGGGIGSDEEWVDIKSLAKYEAILEDFLRALAQ